MTKEERAKAIDRRLRNKNGGNGYWAVVDAKKKIEEKNNAVLHSQD